MLQRDARSDTGGGTASRLHWGIAGLTYVEPITVADLDVSAGAAALSVCGVSSRAILNRTP